MKGFRTSIFSSSAEPALDGSTEPTISTLMEAYLHATGSPRTARRMVETVQRIGPPPARALDGTLAREALTLVVGGVKQEVEIERRERPNRGAQGYWHCPACDRRCCALFVIGNALKC